MSQHALARPALARPGAHLADALPGGLTRDVLLVLAGTALIVLAAPLTIPLPFTPVPIALSTFAVFAVGASLGPLRGVLSAALYLAIGVAGAPVFSGGQSGVGIPTFGYIIGFVIAAAVVGRLASHRADRHVPGTLALGALGTLAMYACGVPWLAVSLGIGLREAIMLGVVPFLLGDALKVLALAGLLPTAWKLVGALRPETAPERR
ncbi:biotin biosynthesis protein BioY [Brachybacterium phenoliresistens]|uniref:Biotin transporter n=1 Tax=Brachybacterium phenoliresistens TaxID=396014 RepID=Z9JU57_9MICO|nr:biotin transporter BioY [Brachybacterium phenoliresistens]EWS81336.1 biotin biosynthesis protein BioY [Brachybacterium phenoliresistens]